MQKNEPLRFLNPKSCAEIAKKFGTPCFVYSEKGIRASAEETLKFPNAFGLTVRYAMKASPNAAILKIFDSMGLHIDASSGYEVYRALKAGIKPEKICLSSQELPNDFAALHQRGVKINACSLHQLQRLAGALPGQPVGLRFNPGMGSGGTGKTNVGGPSSSFGIWHQKIPEVKEILKKSKMTAQRVHTHIGSGSDPKVWQRVAHMSLDLVKQFPKITTLNLGGGYKVGRMASELSTNLQTVAMPIKTAFENLATNTGRRIHLEIEPGTFLLANNASLLCRVQDLTDTGEEGHTFIKLNTGMTEILRPSLYAAQHPIVVVNQANITKNYIVVGHCCESGDLLTPDYGNAEKLLPRNLNKTEIGDLCVIEGVGAYCASMSCKNYNSFPEVAEVLLPLTGETRIIRRRQTLEQIIQNEV